MSWERTYTHTLAIATDVATASLFWNVSDLCISTLCRLVQLSDQGEASAAQLAELAKFSELQIELLRRVAAALERLQAGHCELSRLGDLARAQAVATLLC